jgi:hypothetical protein
VADVPSGFSLIPPQETKTIIIRRTNDGVSVPGIITEHVLCILSITELYIYKKTLRSSLEILKLALKRRRARGSLDAGKCILKH